MKIQTDRQTERKNRITSEKDRKKDIVRVKERKTKLRNQGKTG